MWLLYVKIYVLTIKILKIFLTHAFTLSQQSTCILCPESSSVGTSCRASVCVHMQSVSFPLQDGLDLKPGLSE